MAATFALSGFVTPCRRAAARSKATKIPNQITVWDKGSLRSSCSAPKRAESTMSSRRSRHIVGPASRSSRSWSNWSRRHLHTKRDDDARHVSNCGRLPCQNWSLWQRNGNRRRYTRGQRREKKDDLCSWTPDPRVSLNLTQTRHSFGPVPIEAVARVHHMRTNRCSSSPHTNPSKHRQKTQKRSTKHPRLHSRSLRCKVQVAQAGGEWSELHCRREVTPHKRIPSSPLIMRKSPVCTGTMPRSRQWIAPFANLPRVLTPENSGEGAKQLDKRVSSTPKGPHCTMTSCRRAVARAEA